MITGDNWKTIKQNHCFLGSVGSQWATIQVQYRSEPDAPPERGGGIEGFRTLCVCQGLLDTVACEDTTTRDDPLVAASSLRELSEQYP